MCLNLTKAAYSSELYAPNYRLRENPSPVLTCTNQSDRFTVADITRGNGLLTKPIGSADEATLAGGGNLITLIIYIHVKLFGR